MCGIAVSYLNNIKVGMGINRKSESLSVCIESGSNQRKEMAYSLWDVLH